jgi:RNA polymerase sigma factor (sigma-70 family)
MEPLWTRETEQALEAQANALLGQAPPSRDYPFVQELKTWRRRRREVAFCEELAVSEEVLHPHEQPSTDEVIETCASEMEQAKLTAEERACLYLTEYQGLSQRTVATILGYTDRTVRTRLASAVAKLQALRARRPASR